MKFNRFIYNIFFLSALLLPLSAVAQFEQETAIKLEDIYKNAAAVSVSFSTKEHGKVSLTLSSKANTYKLTSMSDDFISDGKSVWHLIKKDKKVVIDNAKPSAKTMSAEELLKFSDNYTPSIAPNKDQLIHLTLTPHSNIQQMFSAVGGISSITFVLAPQGKSYKVLGINAIGGNGTIKLDHLQIKSMKKISDDTFRYKPEKDITVVDLRD